MFHVWGYISSFFKVADPILFSYTKLAFKYVYLKIYTIKFLHFCILFHEKKINFKTLQLIIGNIVIILRCITVHFTRERILCGYSKPFFFIRERISDKYSAKESAEERISENNNQGKKKSTEEKNNQRKK